MVTCSKRVRSVHPPPFLFTPDSWNHGLTTCTGGARPGIAGRSAHDRFGTATTRHLAHHVNWTLVVDDIDVTLCLQRSKARGAAAIVAATGRRRGRLDSGGRPLRHDTFHARPSVCCSRVRPAVTRVEATPCASPVREYPAIFAKAVNWTLVV